MSIYVITGKSITNTSSRVAGADISTQNEYDSTWVGFMSASKNTGLNNTFMGYYTGAENETGSSNTFLGNEAGRNNANGAANTFVGSGAGHANANGTGNLFIGVNAGFRNTSGFNNVYIGNGVGQFLNGNNNVLIGFNNTAAAADAVASNNVAVGFNSIASGYLSEVIGFNNVSQGRRSTIIGRGNRDASLNSIIIGENITNFGENAFIVMSQCNAYTNRTSNVININNALLVHGLSNGRYQHMNANVNNVVLGNHSHVSITPCNVVISTACNAAAFSSNGLQLVSSRGETLLLSPTSIQFNTFSLSNAFGYVSLSSNLDMYSINSVSLASRHSHIHANSNLLSVTSSVDILAVSQCNFTASTPHSFFQLASNQSIISSSRAPLSLHTPASLIQLNTSGAILGAGCNVSLHASSQFLLSNPGALIQGSASNMQVLAQDTLALHARCNLTLSNSHGQLGLFQTASNAIILLATRSNNLARFDGSGTLVQSSNDICLINQESKFCLHQNQGIVLSAPSVSMAGKNGVSLSTTNNANISMTDSNIAIYHPLQTSLCNQTSALSLSLNTGISAVTQGTFAVQASSNIAVHSCNDISLLADRQLHLGLDSNNYMLMNTSNTRIVAGSNVFIFSDQGISVNGGSSLYADPSQPLTVHTLNVQSDSGGSTPPSLNVSGHIKIEAGDFHWKEFVLGRDLIFQSKSGTCVSFVDDFATEVLNFTGKHRCTFSGRPPTEQLIGKIVIASGRYKDLEDMDRLTIDEAIPIVRLCRKPYDARVFGVIGAFDSVGKFSIGNVRFFKQLQSCKCVVQSLGEGCIWVCDAAGRLRNGDYIVASSIPGYGMRQGHALRANYTVAKITSDCDFRGPHSKTIMFKGRTIRTALVGCVYCC